MVQLLNVGARMRGVTAVAVLGVAHCVACVCPANVAAAEEAELNWTSQRTMTALIKHVFPIKNIDELFGLSAAQMLLPLRRQS
jgi:hypothetical protein